jgi:hypothetical protein
MTPRVAGAIVAAFAAITAPAATAGVDVSASVAPAPTLFGDVVHATVRVRAPVEATVEGGFAPFRVLRSRPSHQRTRGGVVTIWRIDLQCLEPECAPGPGSRTVALASARVRAGPAVAVARVPSIVVAPRANARQVASPEAAFLHPTAPVAPTYRFAPSTTRAVLFVAAALLALVAAVLLVPFVRPTRARPEPDPLARALALLRASRERPVPDRRRALGLLSRILRERRGDEAAARAAADLAWSEPEPDSEGITRVADAVEAP